MKPRVRFGLGMVVGTVLGVGLVILFVPIPGTTPRYLLLPLDRAEQHQAEGSTQATHLVATRATTLPPARQATPHFTARDTALAEARPQPTLMKMYARLVMKSA